MRLEMVLGSDPDFTRWVYDAVCSSQPHIERFNLPVEPIGDFDTLQTAAPTRGCSLEHGRAMARPCRSLVPDPAKLAFEPVAQRGLLPGAWRHKK